MQDKSMKKTGSGRSPQTEPVRRRRSAWMAAAVMSIPFFIAMYFIFGNTETEQDAGGLKDLPEAQEQYIIEDKREAADREQSEIRAQARSPKMRFRCPIPRAKRKPSRRTNGMKSNVAGKPIGT